MSNTHIGKAEFVDQIQSKLEANSITMTKTAISEVLESVLELIVENAKAETEIRFKNFGTFKPQILAAKKGVNPRTGKKINIPARTKVAFKMSGVLKDQLNQSN